MRAALQLRPQPPLATGLACFSTRPRDCMVRLHIRLPVADRLTRSPTRLSPDISRFFREGVINSLINSVNAGMKLANDG